MPLSWGPARGLERAVRASVRAPLRPACVTSSRVAPLHASVSPSVQSCEGKMCLHTQEVHSALHLSSRGATCSLVSSPRKHGLGGHGGSRVSARPGIVKEGTGQTEAAHAPWVASGGPLSVLGLKSQTLVHIPGQDPTCCLEGSLSPRVCLPPAPRSLCAQKAACLVTPCPQHLARGPARSRCSVSVIRGNGLSVHLILRAPHCRRWVHRGSRGRQAHCPACDMLSQIGPGLCGRRPSPGHPEPARGASATPHSLTLSQ